MGIPLPGVSGDARATPAPRLTLSPRVKQPEDERPRGSVAPRISASEPARALGMQRSLREKQHSRARSLFEFKFEFKFELYIGWDVAFP